MATSISAIEDHDSGTRQIAIHKTYIPSPGQYCIEALPPIEVAFAPGITYTIRVDVIHQNGDNGDNIKILIGHDVTEDGYHLLSISGIPYNNVAASLDFVEENLADLIASLESTEAPKFNLKVPGSKYPTYDYSYIGTRN